MIDGRFPVVVADFPWCYRNKKTGGTHKSGASQHYKTISLDEMKEFPIHDIIGEDGILFLWVPVPLKFEGVDVVNHWGKLKYKTSIIWKKVNGIGMGFWARGVIEELWILVKGNNVKALRWQGKNILEESNYLGDFPAGFVKSKTGKIHSRKPEIAFKMIEEMIAPFPNLSSKVELFATQERPGWETVGHELGSDVFEFAEHCKLPLSYSKSICSLCGQKLAEKRENGCVLGDCSFRPRPQADEIFDPYRARLDGQLKPFKDQEAA